MTKKQKLVAFLPLAVLISAAGSWLIGSAVDDMVTQRSINETLIEEPQEPVLPDEDVITKAQDDSPGTTLSEENLEKLGIEKIEEEQIYYAQQTTPDDSVYPQWYTTLIRAPEAWDISTGSSETIVAVIDSGYALAHEDLIDAWHVNAGESGLTADGDRCWVGVAEDKASNGCDDDDNGYIDDSLGWDFSNNDNYPQAGDNSLEGSSHGTRVAGMVGARGNNATGVASVNWQTKIMPLQALYDEGYGFSSDIAGAIIYAVDNGADVINMSLGGPNPDSIILAAIQYADNRNVIVVTSSGNCGEGQSSGPCIGFASPGGMGYPARYEETIAVGASTQSDVRASFSSYGPELDIVAPGSGTIQTPTWTAANETSAYSTSVFGTSFSSPLVAGVVASVKGLYPNINRNDVLAILTQGADKPGSMNGAERTDEYGYGRVNVLNSFNIIDIIEQDVEKTSGTTPANDQPPQISTNIGHTSSSPITNARQASTYCVTSPNTACALRLKKQGTTQTIDMGTKITNAQGIAQWTYYRSDVGTTGTFNATVSANGINSPIEILIIN